MKKTTTALQDAIEFFKKRNENSIVEYLTLFLPKDRLLLENAYGRGVVDGIRLVKKDIKEEEVSAENYYNQKFAQ